MPGDPGHTGDDRMDLWFAELVDESSGEDAVGAESTVAEATLAAQPPQP